MSSKSISLPSSNNSTEKSSPRLGYLPALDGLRALAVLAVLFYHADVLWLPGGFLGVEVFFVVSGFLITSLLLSEYRASNSVNLLQFWRRRARRLLPALFALLFAVMVYAVVFLPEEVASLRADLVASFAYVTNWYLIAAQQSYFETMGRPSLLRHLWSLAVEEQFYLLWPLIFAFLLVRFKSRTAMLLLMLGATISALWMGALYQPDTDPSRIYYGTDTRAAGLLIGAALAFVVRRGSQVRVSLARRWLLDLVGIAALGALVAATLFMSEFDPFLYQGGMLLVAAFSALVIATAIAPNSPLLGGVLGFGVLRWIGLRSYSLYLWHWPVFMVTRPQLDTTLEGTPLLALRFVLTFALAELSYRLVETPIRTGALGRAWNSWTATHGARRWLLGATATATFAAFAIGAFFLGSAVIYAQPAPEPDYVLMTAEEESVSASTQFNIEPLPLPDEPAVNTVTPGTETVLEEPATSDLSSVSFVIEDEPGIVAPLKAAGTAAQAGSQPRAIATRPVIHDLVQGDSPALTNNPIQDEAHSEPLVKCDVKCQARLDLLEMKEGIIRPAAPPARAVVQTPKIEHAPIVAPAAANAIPITPPGDAQVLAIGDSVMLGASNYLRRNIAAIDVDAKLGRQVSAALAILRERADAKLLTPVVVIHLGNNGTFTTKQFDEMMTVLKDVPRVVLLTDKVPRKWQEPNNQALTEGVLRYPNTVLIDWNSVSAPHPEWFWSDGIHLRPEGAQVYTELIADALNQPYQ